MNEIYVTGHRNPDTDSIVAAMAYANLRKALGDREYTAVRIGSVNDETLSMLKRFGFEAPPYVKNMRNQVCDLDFDHPPELPPSPFSMMTAPFTACCPPVTWPPMTCAPCMKITSRISRCST